MVVVREGGIERFGTVTAVMPGEPATFSFDKEFLGTLPTRRRGGRTVGTDHILAATTIQLFGGNLRQKALAEAREAARNTAAG
ncbi:hypothetical protein [Streptomyces mutabilis]|uniref:hypothetical protein n=1 Tax=Streptomyces mutabilis TaxID=67332 RepID=UPI0036C37BE4